MKKLKEGVHRIIFGVETTAGRVFDVLLLILILSSILVLMLESAADIKLKWGVTLRTLEWIITGLLALSIYSGSGQVKRRRLTFSVSTV